MSLPLSLPPSLPPSLLLLSSLHPSLPLSLSLPPSLYQFNAIIIICSIYYIIIFSSPRVSDSLCCQPSVIVTAKAAGCDTEMLWTDKYRPSSLSQLLVDEGHQEVMRSWLGNWKECLIRGDTATRLNSKRKKRTSAKAKGHLDGTSSPGLSALYRNSMIIPTSSLMN